MKDRVRDAQLANVVEQAGSRNDPELGCCYTQRAANLDAELGDAVVVALSLAVLDFDCCNQCGDRLNIDLFGFG